MSSKVETLISPDVMTPIGPYSHIAKTNGLIMISAIAGVDPATGALAGDDIASQTRQIVKSFEVMLASVNSDLAHIMHVTVFLTDMENFKAMNDAYAVAMGDHCPARSAVAVSAVPKPGALVTMNLTAVEKD